MRLHVAQNVNVSLLKLPVLVIHITLQSQDVHLNGIRTRLLNFGCKVRPFVGRVTVEARNDGHVAHLLAVGNQLQVLTQLVMLQRFPQVIGSFGVIHRILHGIHLH